ncbi:MAG TPA: ABC transporter ATP-binding protein [Pyrinomonadaceae bacterium]|nr:ABC transporter ATP-binding protein [Pyrinomonadaceae bacterium]
MGPVIEINNLSKDYETGFWRKKKVRALDGLTLSVEGGQIFGFLGGNGAGKTTTIKILMGLLFATEGTARILGRDISDVSMHREIGYCPENPYFYDYLTAFELMNYMGELFGRSRSDQKEISASLLAKVGIEEKDWDRQLRKFSKGMLQRVGLAQSLVNDPSIVFLDEPMSGLDPVGRREIRELIAGLRSDGKTVFMSTHILSDVEALCDRVAILRGGRLAATGDLLDLLGQEGETRAFEIVAAGVSQAMLNDSLPSGVVNVSQKASGLSIEVTSESDVGPVLRMIHEKGGKLLLVQPVKQSLEEYFVKETSDDRGKG